MTKIETRLSVHLGRNINIDELADHCEVNSIAYRYGEPVSTSDLLSCSLKFIEFNKMPLNIKRCFCGRLIEKCFVINHIPSSKQFVLGESCLYNIFGDRLKKHCSDCGSVSSRECRVGPGGKCKKCVHSAKKAYIHAQRCESNPVSFEFNGSSYEKYIIDRHTLCGGLALRLIKFGKYKNLYTISQIYEKDPSYFRWLTTTVDSMRIFHGYFDQLEI